VIITISSDREGTWNLFAKESDDELSPLVYIARGRSPWAIKALVHGILTDCEQGSDEPSEVTE
jgi:hypothetical protein